MPAIKAKRYNPRKEGELVKIWEKEGIYRFNKETKKPIFSIDLPPPYASGRWHIGAAVHYTQIDMVARYFRMRGNEVLFPFGIDRNGLPVEVEVEKERGISIQNVPREKFLAICRSFLDKVEGELIRLAKMLGMSCDFANYYRTDSPEYRRITQATFIEMYRRGLVFEDDRPTNWCPVCRTTIADAEVDYREVDGDLNYIRFDVEGGGELVIATTRPELLCSCGAVIFNPLDGRYKGLEGRYAVVPIYGKKVPILPHGYAKPEFGTGIMMVCSFGDYSDLRIYKELNLSPLIAINERGKMNRNAGPYEGLTVEEARKKITEDLKRAGRLVKVERIRHREPICWRSKNPIEFISMPEYYLKQIDFIPELRQIIDKIEFYPPESKTVLENWINSLSSDWPISRRRYYATEIPIWYCKGCRKALLPEPGPYYQPWKEQPPFKRCECGSMEFEGETRTFDTWMDSSISSLYVIGYGWDHSLFKRAFPCSLRPQGVDIVRSWLYYSILRAYHLFRKQAFKMVRISGMGLDEKGEAMHKSKGNVIYPEPLIEKYGADAIRLWGAMEARLGSDYRFSERRLAGASRFLTKLWNISRFISMFPRVEDGFRLTNTDRMMLATLNQLIESCTRGYDSLDFFVPSTALREFSWSVFADHFIECVKARAYNAGEKFDLSIQRGAWYTLHSCLQTLLKLLAPICPFITDTIWREVYGGSVHTQAFPVVRKDWESDLKMLLEKFMDFNKAVWKYKKEKGLHLSESIERIYASKELQPLKMDLQSMHKIEKLYFGRPRVKSKRIGEGIYVV